MSKRLVVILENTQVVRELAPNSRLHWRAKSAASARAKEIMALKTRQVLLDREEETIEFTPPLILKCKRYYSHPEKAFDEDALPSTFKPYIDQLTQELRLGKYNRAGNWVGWDDPERMRIICEQERRQKGSALYFSIGEQNGNPQP